MKIEDLQVGMTVMLKPISDVQNRIRLVNPDDFNRKVVVFRIFKDIDKFSIKENGVGRIIYYHLSAVKHIVKNGAMTTAKYPRPQERFPFVLQMEDARKIIDIACISWKRTLIEKWANPLFLDGCVSISEAFYKEMRVACTIEQNRLFDNIFGNDEPEIKKGTPIWGWQRCSRIYYYAKFVKWERNGVVTAENRRGKLISFDHYSLTPPEL